MIDSVLKGTGNSRFLKSAVPAGTSWADALAMLQAGTFPIDFNGINTEGFQQVGTPLNKANLLKDATAAQIGLPPSTTPDGMFQALGNTGELHVWRKTARDASVSAPGYNLGSRTSADICQNTAGNNGDFGVNVEYASEITVDNNGVISLVSPAAIVFKFNGHTGTFSPTNAANILKNKFLKIVSVSDDNPSATILNSYKGAVFYCESDFACGGYGNSSPGYIIYLRAVKPVTPYPAGFATTYPVSTNPNAYQEGDDAKEAWYVVGEVVSGSFMLEGSYNSSHPTRYNIADTPTVSDDGSLSIPETKQFAGYGSYNNGTALQNGIKGKFIQFYLDPNYPGYGQSSFRNSGVVFIPENVVCTNYNSTSGVYIDRYQPVTGYPAIPARTTIEYLGKLGDKARVQMLSYVGTGTYGSSNPNSLTFDFVPKVVHIHRKAKNENDYYFCDFFLFYGIESDLTATYGTGWNTINWNAKTVSWYSTENAQQQMNHSGEKFTAIAIG